MSDSQHHSTEELKQMILVLALAFYVSIIYLLRKRHDQFLEDTPFAQTESEAHVFTLRFIYADFSFIAVKALEFGLFKTYAIPSISKILSSTGRLVDYCPRRYDDTDLLIREFIEHSPDADRSKLAIDRLNFIHSQYKISNKDYLYVLCIFIVEPIRWVERFGFRSPHAKERHAMHLRWKFIGERMGIKEIPETYSKAEEYLDRYEEKFMVYNPTNERVANSTVALFLSIVPRPIRPLCKHLVYALCPERLLIAMGFPSTSKLLVTFVELSLKAAALFKRFFLPPRISPQTRTSRHTANVTKNTLLHPSYHPFEKTYKDGYRIGCLGSPKVCPVG